MTAARAMEYRIAQHLIQRRARPKLSRMPKFVERLITALAVTALLVLLASCMQELLGVVLAASTVWVIGTK